MYFVTTVFENAIEIWDGETKDERKIPTGHMTIFVDEGHNYTVGDEVNLVVRRVYKEATDPHDLIVDTLSAGHIELPYERLYGKLRPLGDEYPRD